MSHHPERTARNVRPVNQPPSLRKEVVVMMWFGEEAEALLKQLEKLFKRIVVRIVAFQNDWDRCDPIWRFCWQNR